MKPKQANELPSIEYLRTRLRYEAETGKLFWLYNNNMPAQWNGKHTNKEAFTANTGNGYKAGTLNKKRYKAHRVAWALHYGEWPEDQIDHINGNRSDNRICNLRQVTQQENSRNQRKRVNNKSGVTGVFWFKRDSNWQSSIRVGAETIHLGYFKTLEEAAEARKEAERKYGFHKNHGRPA